MIYAGIGSRKAPENILINMFIIARYLAKYGYTLRSGAAIGSDKAFEQGCDAIEGKKEIWLPKLTNKHLSFNFYPTEQHYEIAKTVHPVWERLPDYVKALHARNIGQILGQDLKSPVDFVICWTPDACESEFTRTKETGGTGTAITIASRNNIPVYNLANKVSAELLIKKITILGKKENQMEILNKYKVETHKGTTYIGRGSPLGNPFPITKELPRLEAIAKYKDYIINRILSNNDLIINALKSLTQDSQLLCFCKPAPCHGDIIKEIWEEITSYPTFEEGLRVFQDKHRC